MSKESILKTKHKRAEQLGMPFSTACNKLQRKIMFWLVSQNNLHTCFRCGKLIESVEDFSIDHKQSWLDDNVELFWDLNNIAFSHLLCNIAAGKKPTAWVKGRKEIPREKRIEIARKANKARIEKRLKLSNQTIAVTPEVKEESRSYIEQHTG